jgi:DNA repair ATPase RecN
MRLAKDLPAIFGYNRCTMTFDVQEYRAFLELLYKHPEWREELRQLVLTEELLKLPELVHELTEAHKRSEARLTGVEERLTRIEQSIAELVEITKQHEERLTGVEERLTRIEQSIAELVEITKQHEERLTGVEERLTRIEQSIAELVEITKQHEERLAKVEARLEGVEERLTRLEESVAQLVEVQKQHEERLARVEQSIAELTEAQKRTEERVGRLEIAMAELAEAQKRTEERVGRLEIAMAELAEAQKRTEQQVQRLTDRMGQMAGDLLEIKYRDKPSSYFGRIVRQARLVDLADVEAMLGDRLTDEQLFDLLQLDLVVHGQLRQPKGKRREQLEVWLAIEVSSVVDREDVERAERRAKILRQAGLPVLAVAAGGNLTLGARELAQSKGVVLQADGRLEFLEEALARLME